MSDLWNRKKYYLSEHAGMARLSEAYDLLDPEDGKKMLGRATEEVTPLQKVGRLFLDRMMMPLSLRLDDASGKTVLRLERPGCAFLHPIAVFDGEGKRLGTIGQSILSFSGRLTLSGPQGEPIGVIAAETCCGRKYQFTDASSNRAGTLTHQWQGYSRDLFTSTDDWLLELSGDAGLAPLAVAGALAVDLLFHEN